MSRALDIICLGRAAVDLYGQQYGGRLEDMQTFAKYLGGSSANLAAGLGRLGVRASMLTRVGDEHMGRFVREALERNGVDVSHVRTDPTRLTGFVILGIRSRDDIPHVFFRENCADLALARDDFDEAYIASSRMLALTGTHLSTEGSRAAVHAAVRYAKAHGTQVVLDVDYRPVLWGLAAAGRGGDRFVAAPQVTDELRRLLPDCDIVVGTEEEIWIAGGSDDTVAALRAIRSRSRALIVLKRGAAGCALVDGDVPDRLEDVRAVPGVPVEVLNTVGAGDAFLAGFLYGRLNGDPPEECALYGNACGALVASRHGCTPAMPTREELRDFLERRPRSPGADAALSHLHRVTTAREPPGPWLVLAFDHRRQLEQLARACGRPPEHIARFKRLVADAVETVADEHAGDGRLGVIVDERYGADALRRLTARGLWVGRPVEVPGSRPLQLDPANDIGLHLLTWPSAHVVKCLVYYHPDDPVGLRLEQEERVRALYADAVALDRRLLLELICTLPDRAAPPATAARALRRFYNVGVRPDWWKLEPQTAEGWRAIDAVIAECDPRCKGVLLLGLDADDASLQRSLEVAARHAVCRGFAVGRSIFGPAAREWFGGRLEDAAAVQRVAEAYRRVIRTWRDMRRADGAAAAGIAR
jgi:5-dehydro-2-deoxygluconokinase